MGVERERVQSFGSLAEGLRQAGSWYLWGLGASHQTGWTGLDADIIRRRHGEVTSLGDLLRAVHDRKDLR